MNVLVMMGRLTKDADIRYTQDGKAVAGFSIAVDRRFKREGQPDADFFNCTAFGRNAEFVERWIHKGTKVVISGELQNNNYTNKEGHTVYNVQIIVNSIEFAESKKAAESNAPVENTPAQEESGFVNVPEGVDELLPFN
jgi:single-strand DNA-binding protein